MNIVKLMVKYESEAASLSTNRESYLHLSARVGDVELANSFVHKLPLESVNKSGLSALDVAMKHENYQIARLLVEHGAYAASARKSLGGNSCVHLAVERGLADLVQLLFAATDKSYASALNERRQTPLHLAVLLNDLPMIAILLRHEAANVQLRDHRDETAMDVAIRKNHAGAVELLLAKVDASDYFHASFALRDDRLTRSFLRRGVDVRSKDSDGRNLALYLALKHNSIDVVREIVEMADFDASTGVSPLLHCALSSCAKNVLPLVRLLLDRRSPADVNAEDEAGRTALHYAVSYRCVILQRTEESFRILEYLVRRGARFSSDLDVTRELLNEAMRLISGDEHCFQVVAFLLLREARLSASDVVDARVTQERRDTASIYEAELRLMRGEKVCDGESSLTYYDLLVKDANSLVRSLGCGLVLERLAASCEYKRLFAKLAGALEDKLTAILARLRLLGAIQAAVLDVHEIALPLHLMFALNDYIPFE